MKRWIHTSIFIVLLMLAPATALRAQDNGEALAELVADSSIRVGINSGIAFTTALQQLEEKFDISFIYKMGLLEGVTAPSDIGHRDNLTDELHTLLEPYNLKYTRLNNRTFALSFDFSKYALGTEEKAQEQISGTVTDGQSGETLPGVNILIKGTSTGASTDADGNFELTVESLQDTLVVSFVGYQTKEVPIDGRTEINVALQPQAIAGEEMVVIGYGEQKKSSLTSAVSNIEGEEISSVPVSDVSNSLGGKLPGVITKQGSGEPGRDGSTMFIRGISSTGSNQPLLIVDGIRRDFTDLDPNTIKTVTVLKDAAAVAPYGVAGANGVILVETKSGEAGEPSFTFESSTGFQNPTVLPNYVSSYEFASLKNAAAENVGNPVPYSDYALQKFQDGSNTDVYPSRDSPFEGIVNSNTILTNHNFQVSGGTEKITYYGALGYQYQQGMWSQTNNEQYNFAIKLDGQITKSTDVTFSLKGIRDNSHYPATTQGYVNSSGTGRIFELFGFATPEYGPHTYSNGMYGTHVKSAINGSGYSKINATQIFSDLRIEQDLSFITSGLAFEGRLAYDPEFSNQKIWKTPMQLATIDTTQNPDAIEDGIFGDDKPRLSQEKHEENQITYHARLDYIRQFRQHNINIMALFEARSNDSNTLVGSKTNYNVPIAEFNMGNPSKQYLSLDGYSSTGREMGLVYRFKYDFANKYLFEATGRYDGHYYFAPSERFGFFPSFSAAWQMSEENFLDDVTWLDNLKLRVSYGKVGALAGGPFQYLSTYNVLSSTYAFGGSTVQGLREGAEPNANITWEESVKRDIGLDISVLNGRFDMTIDYFYEKRSNMLVAPNTQVPEEYGVGLSQVNKGRMQNQGYELSANYQFQTSEDFEISLGGNLTYTKNKVLEIFETPATFNNPNRRRTGKPLGTQFGYKALGYFQEDDFDAEGNLKEGIANQPWGAVQPGDIRYADINGNGEIDVDDRTAIGDPQLAPRMLYGISSSVNYKNFGLNLFFQGAARTSYYYHPASIMAFYNGMHAYETNLDYWTPENPDAEYPRITPAPTANNSIASSFWVDDASYLRLKTITLSYTLPNNLSTKLGLQNARIYLSGRNLLTFTDVKNVDPEIGNNTSYIPNSGAWSYPLQKTISVGIKISTL